MGNLGKRKAESMVVKVILNMIEYIQHAGKIKNMIPRRKWERSIPYGSSHPFL
jgi:hypothetical protein